MKKFIGIIFVFTMILSCMTACVENPESETAVYAARTERAGTEGNPVVIEYDSLDRKIKETCFYFDGSIKFYTIFEYYPGGNTMKKETAYRPDNTIFMIEDYDTNGNGVKTSYYDEDEELVDYLICEFDSNGHITKQTMYDADGNIKK